MIHGFVKDSLAAGLGDEGGIAGLGGMVEQGLPILDGGLSPDGFSSVIFYVHTVTLYCNKKYCYINYIHIVNRIYKTHKTSKKYQENYST